MTTSNSRWNLLRGFAVSTVALALCFDAFAQPAPGAERPSRRPRTETVGFKENPKVWAVFRDVVRGPGEAVVRIKSDGKDIALGTVVAADGLIVTKHSELPVGQAPVLVRLRDGRELPAKVTAVDSKLDLALLKIEATGLKTAEFADSKVAVVGNLLAAPGPDQDPVAVGVVSVATRMVKPRELPSSMPPKDSGFLGVGLEEAEGGAKIMSVLGNSAAEKAGLKINDVVTLIADTAIIDTETMINTIQHHKPGEVVAIKIKRDGQEQEFRVTLGQRPPEDPRSARRDYQNKLGSELSNRRGGFPAILQSDMVVKPTDCGGPVVDLDGRVIGLSIARAGRTESYVLPGELVKKAVDEMKAGRVAAGPEKK
ncbi:MAG TPA: S1C family serine protease [Tepidisphaeraceae bacterium]|nr:S1C family serine protease [Tepidisphaeraceae bacterium]